MLQQFLEAYEADGASREFLDAMFVKELSKEEFQELYLKVNAVLCTVNSLTVRCGNSFRRSYSKIVCALQQP